ncbi:MAG: hypothetical protein ACR2QB_04700 [Gammaproteobacteria bacterium]
MSEAKHSETMITNEQTRHRREWVERALEGVRGRFAGGADGRASADSAPRPNLYVVGSRRSR